jgi:hypothetical protein
LDNSVTIYPNPVSSEVNISYYSDRSEAITIKVLDGLGATVRIINTESNKGKNTIQIDVNELPVGVYQILLYRNQQVPEVYKFKKD